MNVMPCHKFKGVKMKYGAFNLRMLVATQAFYKGDEIMDLSRGVRSDERTQTSIQMPDGTHCEHDCGRFINHSCDPNGVIDGTKLIAVKDIEIGEEITFDYNSNEDDIASPFTCRECGAIVGKEKCKL